MPEEKHKIQVGVGEKGEKPSSGEVKKGQKPQEPEVGGRYRQVTWVTCPYCYAANHIIEETTERLPFECWNCHGVFWY